MTKPTSFALLALVLLLLSGPVVLGYDNRAAEDDIREAVFRDLLPHGPLPETYPFKVSFLAFTQKEAAIDPSDAFLKRFTDYKTERIAKYSGATGSERGVKDKKTGEEGEILTVFGFKWISDDEAQVSSTEYASDLAAVGMTYHLKKKDGKWVIVKRVRDWIS